MDTVATVVVECFFCLSFILFTNVFSSVLSIPKSRDISDTQCVCYSNICSLHPWTKRRASTPIWYRSTLGEFSRSH